MPPNRAICVCVCVCVCVCAYVCAYGCACVYDLCNPPPPNTHTQPQRQPQAVPPRLLDLAQ